MGLRYLLLLFLLTANALQPKAQEWELQKDENGIKVYNKPNANSGFNSFKAVMTLDLPAQKMLYFLQHIDQHPNAFPDTKELKILKRPNDTTQIQYSLTDAPWPVSDRDGIYKLTFSTNRKTGVITSKGVALPTYLPEKKDIVRIQKSETYWIITPISASKCQIEYIVHAEPGGSIPDWLANSAAIDVPFNTFVNIRREIKK